MGNLQDASINVKPQSVFGTPATPDRAFEFLPNDTLDWNWTLVQGEGLRVGSFVDRSARQVAPVGEGDGDLTMEVMSKGFGYWWQACLGTVTSTLVSGATFQQVHSWASTPADLTVQKATVRADGTVDPVTFANCAIDSWELSFENSGLVKLKVTLDIGDYSTATGFATLVYATTPNLFHFGNWTLATGTLTAATTTALASAVTPLTNVRSLTITANRNPVDDRFNALGTGRKSQQIGTKFDLQAAIEFEYTSITQRDAYLLRTAQTLVSTVTGGALSTGLETLQVVIGEMKAMPGGGIPQTNDTGLIVQSLTFNILDNLTAAPIQIVTRTADTTV